ncbi:hypothetical protein [Streptomyces sp. NPDC002402]
MSPSALLYAPTRPARPAVLPVIAYQCEVVAHDLAGAREVLLGHYRARSPRLAARWLWSEAERLARLLAPLPSVPCLRNAPLFAVDPDCSRPDDELLAWTRDDRRFEQALRTLAACNPYAFAVTDYDAQYAFCAYPLRVRMAPKFPVSAGCSSPSPAEAGRQRRRGARHAAR